MSLSNKLSKIEKDLKKDVKVAGEEIGEFTKTLFGFMQPAHNWASKRHYHYHRWHQNPVHKPVHWSTLVGVITIIILMILNILPAKAGYLTKEWTSTDDFAGGTNTTNATNQLALASTTNSDFTEPFTDSNPATWKKDAVNTDATWNTADHKLTLPGDPNGTATNYGNLWKSLYGITESINATAFDTANHLLFFGSNNSNSDGGTFVAYSTISNTTFDLTSKIYSTWGAQAINSMVYDPVHQMVYLVGQSGRFGAFKANSTDPSNGTWYYLGGKITGWGSSPWLQSVNYGNGKIYIGGAGLFGAFNTAADPSQSDSIQNLTSFIVGNWPTDSSNYIRAITYDSINNKIYIGGDNGRLGVLVARAAGDNAIAEDWNYLAGAGSGFNTDWSTTKITSLTFDNISDPVNGTVYIGGYNGKLGAFEGGSAPQTSGVWYYLYSMINANWSTSYIMSLTFDSTNHIVYLGGSSGKLGAIITHSTPTSGTWRYLTTTYAATFGVDWGTQYFTSMCFDNTQGQNKVYMIGGTTSGDYSNRSKFGSFVGGADPGSGGVWANLITQLYTTSLRSESITASATDPINNIVYITGSNSRVAAFKNNDETIVDISYKFNTSGVLAVIVYGSYGADTKAIYFGASNSTSFWAYSCNADPTTGTATNLENKYPAGWTTGDKYKDTLAFDPNNKILYFSTYNNKWFAMKVGSGLASATGLDITTVVFSKTGVSRTGDPKNDGLIFDTQNNILYMKGTDGKFAAFKGASNGANPENNDSVGCDLSATLRSTWASGTSNLAKVLVYDAAYYTVYIGGGGGNYGPVKFAAFHGGSEPSVTGDWYNLSTVVSNNWGTNTYLYISSFDYNAGLGKIYLSSGSGDSYKFGSFSITDIPSNGQFVNLTNTLTNTFSRQGAYPGVISGDNVGRTFLAASSEFVKFESDYQNGKNGVSLAVDNTTQNIASATISATTSSAPEGVTFTYTYYLSNNGGTWEGPVTPGTAHTFTTTGTDLRWKINLQSSNLAYTPEVTNVAISYSYYPATGAWEGTFDSETADGVTWWTTHWESDVPADTTLTAKYATSSDNSSWTDFSSNNDLSDGVHDDPAVPGDNINLQDITTTGALADSRYIKVHVDFGSSGAGTPTLSSIAVNYVKNVAPEIQNLTASQSTDGTKIVNVSYQSKDQDTNESWTDVDKRGKVTPTLYYSTDGSDPSALCTNVTWSDVTAGKQTITDNTTGFAARTAAWDIGAQFPNLEKTDTLKVKVKLNDGELARNTVSAASAAFSAKTTLPVATSILVNGNDVDDTWLNTLDTTLAVAATDSSFVSGSVGYMMIGNDASFTGSSWQRYDTAPTWSLSGADGTKTVYIKFKDEFGNVSASTINDTITLDTTPPGVPQNVSVYDTSNGSTEDYSLAVIWSSVAAVDDFDTYVVERKIGVDGVWSEVYTPSNTTGQIDNNNGRMNNTDTYYYRVKSRDIHDNDSGYFDNNNEGVVSYMPASVDITSPEMIVTNKTVTPGENTCTITWSTDENADSLVEYGTTTGYGGMQGISESVKDHSVNLVGLEANTTYYYRLRSTDSSGNLATSVADDYHFQTTTGEALAVDELPVAQSPGIGSEEVTITWTTNKPSTSEVLYAIKGATCPALTSGTVKDDILNLSHSVKITELSPGTTYCYQVKSTIAAYNKEILGSVSEFTTESVDTTAPEIYDTLENPISAAISTISASEAQAVITWTTDEASTSQVQWGTSSGSLTTTTPEEDTTSNTNHSVTLSELTPGATYYYKVVSADASANSSTSAEHSFTTIVFPSITSNVTVENITNNAADVSWSTNTDTDSYIVYGTALDAEGNVDESKAQGTDTFTNAHLVNMVGLEADQTYYYQIKCKDAFGNEVLSSADSFKTSLAAAPVDGTGGEGENAIGNVNTSPAIKAKDVITTDVIITWYTNFLGSSFVEYGLTDSYGREEGTSDLVNNHEVTITGLLANTTYHYRVKSVDKDGHIYVSPDNTFTTSSVIEASISEVSVTNIGLDSATIIWKTTNPSTSKIEYGKDTNNLDQSTTETDLSGNSSHSVTLTGLSSGESYGFRIKSQEVDGDKNLLVSPPYTFVTVAIPTASDIKIDVIDSNTAKATWTTNVEARSLIEFSPNTDFKDSLEKSSGDYLKDHQVQLERLADSTKYYYRVKSADKYGNQGISATGTFTTSNDNRKPDLTNVKSEVSTIGTGDTARIQMIVSWNSDEPATSFVDYGEGVGKEEAKYVKTVPTIENSDPSKLQYNQSHVIVIQNLKDSTTYHFRVRSNDKASNEAVSQDYTVLTPKKTRSVLQVIVDTLEKQFGWIVNIKSSLGF